MITKTETRNGVVKFVSDTFERNGFKWNAKEQYFLKATTQGSLVFDLHFYNETNIKTGDRGFLVEPYIWIYIDQIEEIYNRRITVNEVLKGKASFITLGNSVADLKANPTGIYKIRNKSLDLFVFEAKNINYVSFEILTHFKETAIPYFDQNCSTKAANLLLNMHPREYCVHIRNDVFRIIKGLIAAWIMKNPKFSSLMQTYKDIIIERDMPDDCKEELINFEEYIKIF